MARSRRKVDGKQWFDGNAKVVVTQSTQKWDTIIQLNELQFSVIFSDMTWTTVQSMLCCDIRWVFI